MTNDDGRPIADVDFDHHSDSFAEDPWSQLAELRERCPVARTDAHGGFWVLSSYETIKQVASDDLTFSSAESVVIPPKKNASQKSIPIEMDPPHFQAYRRILHPMLSPTAVERLAPTIEFFVHQCIDKVIEKGSCDFVHDLADPLPAMTTLLKLGLPLELWEAFSVPLHKVVFLRQDNPLRENIVEELNFIAQTIKETIASRRKDPRDDMITYLINSEIDGRPLTDHEIEEMVTLIIQGGFDTTGSAISNALIRLQRDRDARRTIIEDPGLLTSAVEEFLRVDPPQFALARTATSDVTIEGRNIKKGDRVLMVWASGNRDPIAFEDPDQVVLDRFPNRHMTFGLGAHRCLGSTLARRQIVSALSGVLRRMPEYEIDFQNAQRPETIGIAYGMFSLPATFPSARRWFR